MILTDRSIMVLVDAVIEAEAANRFFTGTEHILLALIKQDGGIGKKALDQLGITEDDIYYAIKKIQPRVVASR